MKTTNELSFKIVFGLLWILYFVVRIYFQKKVKGVGGYTLVNEKREKLFFRLFALAYLLQALYFTPWADFAHIQIPSWLRWGGGLITLAGIILFGWTHHVLGLNWTAILALSEKHRLVTSGPYHLIRHPMYTAFFVIGFGFLFLSANWLISVIYLGTLTAMYTARVSVEEKMMLNHFGDEYRQYMARTGRLLPRFRN